ncbi:MAG: ComEA family DNA-binding protein [Actinobacteria bacterium]|nr:ComEA family DNA-binding protein [Actinomycetota bacterium]
MELLRRLFVWWGWQRVVAAVFGVPFAVFAVWWMVRAPAPPVESVIPFAAATTVAPAEGLEALAPLDLGVGNAAVATATSGLVVVHVVGAVVEPGVYELPAGARGDDAVRAAGGLTGDADSRAVNLALQLVDGEQLVIPRRGETLPTNAPRHQPGATAAGNPAAGTPAAGVTGPRTPAAKTTAPRLVNINRATVAELDQLPGVGPSTARAIVEHRERYGPYATVDDLLAVRGIGPAKLAEMRAMVAVS